jgi:hypothetical protein
VSYSGVAETKVDIAWYPPELHELFSIKRYYISFLKHGEKIWSNGTLVADELDESLNFQLNNLESDTFYTLKVTAENEFYLGKESKRMEIKTLKVKGSGIIKAIVYQIAHRISGRAVPHTYRTEVSRIQQVLSAEEE